MTRIFEDGTVEYRLIDGSSSHFDLLRALLRASEKLAGEMSALATAKFNESRPS